MERCKTCKHWGKPESDYGEVPGTGKPKPAAGFKWAVVLDEHDGTHQLQQRLDALGVAIADAGYAWTPAMRAAYEGPNV